MTSPAFSDPPEAAYDSQGGRKPAGVGAFAATASTYDRARRQLIPCFDRFYGTAVELIAAAERPIRRVLDLGAGTGLLAAMVAAEHPAADLVLLDAVPEMLDQARDRPGLADAHLIVGSFADPLPAGPFDAVMSALAIHHLDDAAKEALMARIRDALAPGGIFVNAEQVTAPTAALDAQQVTAWRRAVIANGVSDDDLAAADRRMAADICAPVERQLAWLREAGFVEVDAPFRDGRFAVLTGRRPA